jgi:uncharacterized protein (DUF1330 family)
MEGMEGLEFMFRGSIVSSRPVSSREAAVWPARRSVMPKAFLVAESEILDRTALASYIGPVRSALVAAGGRPAVISSIGGRIIPLVGEPLRNLVVSEWESVAEAEAWLSSPELRALEPQRIKAYRIIRQFIVETAGD